MAKPIKSTHKQDIEDLKAILSELNSTAQLLENQLAKSKKKQLSIYLDITVHKVAAILQQIVSVKNQLDN